MSQGPRPDHLLPPEQRDDDAEVNDDEDPTGARPTAAAAAAAPQAKAKAAPGSRDERRTFDREERNRLFQGDGEESTASLGADELHPPEDLSFLDAPEDSDESDTPGGTRGEARSGSMVIIRLLEKHYTENSLARQSNIIEDFNTYQRRPAESMEESFARYDILKAKAMMQGVSSMDPSLEAHNLIRIMDIDREDLPMLQVLCKFTHDTLPKTDDELIRWRNAMHNLHNTVDSRSKYGMFSNQRGRKPCDPLHRDATRVLSGVRHWRLEPGRYRRSWWQLARTPRHATTSSLSNRQTSRKRYWNKQWPRQRIVQRLRVLPRTSRPQFLSGRLL